MKLYQVDSFTDRLFRGNPAAVCLVYDEWPAERLMQNIAAENNLSETAFVLDAKGELAIRWFTPTTEVSLCGHATLAAAHVLYAHEGYRGTLTFRSPHHTLKVAYEGDLLVLDFPMDKIWQIGAGDVPECFNYAPKQVWRGTDEYMLIFENEAQVKNAVCDLAKAKNIDLEGFIITAAADTDDLDFVSRYFGPKIGIDEDPVTGSAHTLLVPYWRNVLGKDVLRAAQLSARGGRLFCRAEGDRVKIGGKAVTYMVGEISPEAVK
ncbi:MAG: PhzF family phenazine biosynthesis protein [Clostridiales bacterium]|jgi:predicted PhzF superfamily epimerase YddE/YHI9|nr:PhzF family phenazine biosynthesis protein [Clostridiales bacterium]